MIDADGGGVIHINESKHEGKTKVKNTLYHKYDNR